MEKTGNVSKRKMARHFPNPHCDEQFKRLI